MTFSIDQYTSHAAEMGLKLPEVPSLFLKPATALNDPWPQPCILPKVTRADNTGDYESEMAIIIGKEAKDVSEADALEYVLGYTAANDVSSRTAQWAQSQWCFSKGFDMSCPIGMSQGPAVDRGSNGNSSPTSFSHRSRSRFTIADT
jgi:2-keto-4-pentenoate hydratase/2-oxohepta-3-ene-1,7-dioic acid hydratase in catechol pathway